MKLSLEKAQPKLLRNVGLGLISASPLFLLLGPAGVLRSQIHWGFFGRGFSFAEAVVPYQRIFIFQRLGSSVLLTLLGLVAGAVLLRFNGRVSKELAELSEMPGAQRIRLWNAAAITVGLYTLGVAAFGVAVEYAYADPEFYRGFRPLLRYETYIGEFALVAFVFAEGSKFRWLLLFSGIVLLFWAL
jgi:hypothetical protein